MRLREPSIRIKYNGIITKKRFDEKKKKTLLQRTVESFSLNIAPSLALVVHDIIKRMEPVD